MSTIRAGNTTTTGLTYTSDTTGQLNLEAAGGIVKINGTGALTTPAGTTAERPATPAVGMTRYNTTDNVLEVYTGSAWAAVGEQAKTYSIELLVVAGGGAGGRYGGGGAGGLVYYGSETPKTPNGPAQQILPGTSFTVIIGASGAGQFSSGAPAGVGGSGTNSQFGAIATALGGGGGGDSSGNGGGAGVSGGSGGGAGWDSSTNAPGTNGQGSAGGSGTNNGTSYSGGGGGGAGGTGANATAAVAGNGGLGLVYSISGTALAYAGGGGGATYNNADTAGTGGNSVGGNGCKFGSGGPISIAGSAGATNRGGGGGGGSYSGGSGIVILRYLGSQRGVGGTVTSVGGYTVHTFTTSGTFTYTA